MYHVIIAVTSTQRKLYRRWRHREGKKRKKRAISSLCLLPPVAGWFMLAMACLQLVLSPPLYLCFCKEPDLEIAKRCHSPARVFFSPAIRAYLGFLRRWGRKDLTSSYVTRRPKEGLPLAETHRHLPATLGPRCVSVIFHNRSIVELSDLLLIASRLVASSFRGDISSYLPKTTKFMAWNGKKCRCCESENVSSKTNKARFRRAEAPFDCGS